MKTLALAVGIPVATLFVSLVAQENAFEVTNLLSDGAVPADHVDAALVNPWGLAASATGPFWIANEGTGTSSVVLADGSQALADVNVPADNSAHPTGTVFYGGEGFQVEAKGAAGASRFIFVSLDGRILGWSPEVDLENAVERVDNGEEGAVYTGAALAKQRGKPVLYVANFGQGTIDMFGEDWQPIGSFTDSSVPENWSPFNVAALGSKLYVTFVPRNPETGEEIPGPGHGLIDVFMPSGALQHRLVEPEGELDAPWGMVQAPHGFGPFGNALLVGNFGDGRILAYHLHNGTFKGQLEDDEGEPLVIEGIWGLLFGNGGQGGDPDDLYFTAGIQDEEHGLFGEIEPVN